MLSGGYWAVFFMHAVMTAVPSALWKFFPEAAEAPAVHPAMRLAGASLILAGLLLYAASHWHLARSGKGTPAVWQPPRFLVLGGPYRSMRNPMYAAVLLTVAGQAGMFWSPIQGVYALALFAGLHLFVCRVEEPALLRSFGGSYERYRQSVPRWFPRRFPPSDLIS